MVHSVARNEEAGRVWMDSSNGFNAMVRINSSNAGSRDHKSDNPLKTTANNCSIHVCLAFLILLPSKR
jgi:hypothetical protein